MKKVIIALLIVLMVPASIFAGRGLFDLTVGATVETAYDPAYIESVIKGDEEFEFSMEDLAFGADLEAKLAFVSVDARGVFSPSDKAVSGVVSANLALDIFFVRVKAGLGYEYNYNFASKEFYFGNGNGKSTTFGDFKEAAFDITAGVDLLFGPVTVGVHAALPTGVSIGQGNWDQLIPSIRDGWKYSRLGVTLGFALL